jgi:isocitrate dehydrogenase (NAD+)
MAYKITLIPGDGIGPEVTQATVRILEATGVKFEWETFMAGAEAFEKYKEYIPKELTESIERTHVALKGPVTTPIGGGFASINVALRQKFELYANFRPIRNLPHIPTRYPDVDLIIVRENTRASRSLPRKLRLALHASHSSTLARISGRRSMPFTRPIS